MTRKPALSAAVLVAALAVAWVAYERRGEAPTVVTVDNTEAIGELLDARRSAEAAEPVVPAPAASYPPPLVREPLDEETAELFFPSNAGQRWTFDPQCYSRRVAHQEPYFRRLKEHPDGGWVQRTNDYGMREDEDVRAEPPDVRVLVTGDSHTDGVCSQAESFANVLERALAAARPDETVESLNAGVGGANLYNYVGMFERLRHLAPDVYVVAVYGGNDFSGSVVLQRYFERRGAAQTNLLGFRRRLKREDVESLGAQEMFQDLYFWKSPDDLDHAVDLVCSVSVELERLCAAAGTALLLVYLPPPSRAQPQHFGTTARRFCGQSGMPREQMGSSDRIADRWLAFLDERGIPYVDLRPSFRQIGEPLYWLTDHHINLVGHELVAEALYEPVTELLERRRRR